MNNNGQKFMIGPEEESHSFVGKTSWSAESPGGVTIDYPLVGGMKEDSGLHGPSLQFMALQLHFALPYQCIIPIGYGRDEEKERMIVNQVMLTETTSHESWKLHGFFFVSHFYYFLFWRAWIALQSSHKIIRDDTVIKYMHYIKSNLSLSTFIVTTSHISFHIYIYFFPSSRALDYHYKLFLFPNTVSIH